MVGSFEGVSLNSKNRISRQRHCVKTIIWRGFGLDLGRFPGARNPLSPRLPQSAVVAELGFFAQRITAVRACEIQPFGEEFYRTAAEHQVPELFECFAVFGSVA